MGILSFKLGLGRASVLRSITLDVWRRCWRRNETRRDSVRGAMKLLAAAVMGLSFDTASSTVFF
jgi:hypothetical protein